MQTSAFTEQEFKATYGEPMHRAAAEESPPFDFWPYFEAVADSDFQGYDCSEGQVEYVYREPSGRFEHVLVNSNDQNVFMVLVLDRASGEVYGHHLLNLNKEYGLET